MRLKIAVSVVRFRPWAPIKSIAWLNYQISRSRRGQRSGQQSAVFIGRPHGREITGQIRPSLADPVAPGYARIGVGFDFLAVTPCLGHLSDTHELARLSKGFRSRQVPVFQMLTSRFSCLQKPGVASSRLASLASNFKYLSDIRRLA